MIDPSKLQARITSLLTNKYLGVPCTITALDDATLTTSCVFDNALLQNVDNRQNPTPIIGLKQVAFVPGSIAWEPDAGGRLEYTIGGTTYKRRISSVTSWAPTGVAIAYMLGLE
jgi:hypothetical protein